MTSAKGERKRARKQMLRAREQKAARLRILTLIPAGAACVGSVITLVSTFLLRFSEGVAWVAAATGLMVLLAVTFRGTGARAGLPALGFQGWIGLTCGVIASGTLMAPVILLYSGYSGAAELAAALSLVPILFAVGFVCADYFPGGGGGSTSDGLTGVATSHLSS